MYWSKTATFHTPMHSTSPQWNESEYRHTVWYENTRIVGLLDDKYAKVTDRWTDRHSTDRAYA